jgi:hypothetical protein
MPQLLFIPVHKLLLLLQHMHLHVHRHLPPQIHTPHHPSLHLSSAPIHVDHHPNPPHLNPVGLLKIHHHPNPPHFVAPVTILLRQPSSTTLSAPMFTPTNQPPYCQVQPKVCDIPWPTLFHIIVILLHIMHLLLSSAPSQRLSLMQRLLFILNGSRSCASNYMLSKPMALGLSPHYRQARHRLVVDGSTKLNTIRMVLSSGTKLV